MTELYIDEKPVAIPAGTSLTIKQQNPIITKNGTFSLDLALSLKKRNNSILYKHIERLQSNTTFKSRKALLISDNKIILNGSEAYISNTNEEVKIQLLSGNSELNYFIGTGGYISELDLGVEEALTDEHMNTAVGQKYPLCSFAPVKVKSDTEILNNYTSENIEGGWSYAFTNKAIQPYLLGMMEKTIKALGYKITYNQLLDDDLFCRIYFISNVKSLEYNKHLPGWTAKDFLEECERFFNIVFDINPVTKSVEILRRVQANPLGVFELNNILDNFNCEVATPDERTYENVQYDFPSSTYYKYADIDENILKQAVITTFANYSLLAQHVKVDSSYMIPSVEALKYYKTLNIFYVTSSDLYYIVDKFSYVTESAGESTSGAWYYLRSVDRFRKYQTNSDSEAIKLKFFPTQMFYKASSSSLIIVEEIPYQSEKINETELAVDLKDLIENGITNRDSSQKKIAIAIYSGSSIPGMKYSASQTDYYSESVFCIESSYAGDTKTLRLAGINGLASKYYKVNNRYDFTREYTIKFISNIIPDVRADFLFQNKLFVCKELEYTITNDGINPVITGTFLPVIV